MNHQNFFPYHNRLIEFYYNEPNHEKHLLGVVVDIIPYSEKKSPTEYIYIPKSRIKDWESNVNERKAIEETIDIKYIGPNIRRII